MLFFRAVQNRPEIVGISWKWLLTEVIVIGKYQTMFPIHVASFFVTLVCCCLLYTNNTHLHLWLLMVWISIWIVGNFHINNQYVVFIRNLNKIRTITQTHKSICYSSIEYSMHSDWMKCWTIWEVCGFDCVSFNQQLMHANNALRFMNV